MPILFVFQTFRWGCQFAENGDFPRISATFLPLPAPRPPASPEPWPIPRGPAGALLSLDFLRPENIRGTFHAYRTGQALRREAGHGPGGGAGQAGRPAQRHRPRHPRHAPGALDEFHGPRGDFYQNMFAKCPAGRPGAADEAANAAELLVSSKGAFLSGSPLSSSTAGCFYGPLKPEA